MATEIFAGALGEMRTASTAAGGSALTTTATYTALPIGTHWVSLTPRNFATAVVAKIAFNPYLIILKTTDLLATVANLTDYSENAQDGVAGNVVTLNAFDTIANGNALYFGSPLPLRGLSVTIGNTNAAGGSTGTIKYWKSATPNAWADITITDGTKSTDTFRQTGLIVWTVVTDHLKRSITEIALDQLDDTRSGGAVTPETTIALNARPASLNIPMYWYRYETNVAFDAAVTATAILAVNRNTAQYAELLSGQTLEETVHRGIGGIGCIEHLTDAGTANLVINAATRSTGGGFNV